jgi:hypothetical protein
LQAGVAVKTAQVLAVQAVQDFLEQVAPALLQEQVAVPDYWQ